VAEHLGLDLARTVAIGDGENDLELLGAAGYAIAVENGHELVKARADWICPGPGEEGVAQVLEAYLDSVP
jgi:hydroxymethylpyrimidine pyrophosphatase-like HAD family hydrolase